MIKKFIQLFNKKFQTKEKIYTSGLVKYARGEEVKLIIFSSMTDFWYKAIILDINARYIIPSIKESWKVEYYVSFKNSKDDEIRYWVLESELRKYSLQEERNCKIEKILN